jgi:hypothetical protein
MKKIYVLLAVCLSFGFSSFAQDYYWIGPVNGNWNSGANWSHTAGGAAAGTFPSAATDNVIFTANATINLNVGNISLNSLSVNGTTTVVKITGTGGGGAVRNITVNSTDALNPALQIAAGCKLQAYADANTSFTVIFAPDAQASINGDWSFNGDYNINSSTTFLLGDAGHNTRVNVNTGGSITIGEFAFTEPNETSGDYLVFKAGADLNLLPENPIVPEANYDASSNINITGVVFSGVSFEETESIGNLTYNCPGQNNQYGPVSLALLSFNVGHLDVKGTLNILNTGNQELDIISYFSSSNGITDRSATIKGNLNIQGNSRVAIAQGTEAPIYFTVEGNVIANGTSFDLQSGNDISNQPTVLYVGGNIQHTAGTFTASSNAINQTSDLFVIEMNGTAAQTISSHNGTFDNAGNQVTLRINNAAGVTLLNSLAVGRLSFNSANKGVLTTNANVITLNNTTPNSVSSIVLNSPSATGFVNGNIRRKSASTEPLVLAAGAGSKYRPVTLIPASATASTFEAKYIDSDHGGTYELPVRGVANYYWDISRLGAGANAAVQLTIPGAVPGAQAGHDLIVGKYDGSNWVNVKGATGISVSPGNATSGTIRSEAQSTFGSFTIAYESEASLPTLLVSFTGKNVGKNISELKWKITDNSTPSVFEIMRSSDGVHFATIGKVSGVAQQYDYSFTDAAMVSGNNYYRLRMLDIDGSANYSAIVIVSNGVDGLGFSSLMPNVVTSSARLVISSGKSGNVQLLITDMSGRIVQKRNIALTAGSQQVTIDASRLSPGIYQITGFIAGEKATTIRFIKQ